jgi:Tfp pilus assembly protein PilV
LKENLSFTLVELLVAAYILLIGICGILALFANTMISSQSAWDMTVATSHAEHVLEEMQTKISLTEIQSIDWDEWAKKLTTLSQEKIAITFEDPTSDPLDIKVTNTWQSKLRTNTVTLRTKLTK